MTENTGNKTERKLTQEDLDFLEIQNKTDQVLDDLSNGVIGIDEANERIAEIDSKWRKDEDGNIWVNYRHGTDHN